MLFHLLFCSFNKTCCSDVSLCVHHQLCPCFVEKKYCSVGAPAANVDLSTILLTKYCDPWARNHILENLLHILICSALALGAIATTSDLLSYISKMMCIKARSEATEASEDGGCPADECRVCLSKIRYGEATRRLPCRHIFHRDYVDRWLLSYKRTCPLCRDYVADGNKQPVVAKHTSREALADDLVIWFSAVLVPGFWCRNHLFCSI